MDFFSELFHKLGHLDELIRWGGYAALTGIVFSETGLFVGFFLPGDSLLFAAGTLAGSGVLRAPSFLPGDPWSAYLLLNALLMAAAIAGDSVGYWFGFRAGTPLFSRPDSRFFKRRHLEKAHAFYERHGGKTIVLAKWMPFVRTFAPIVAGVARMPYRRFLPFSVLGGISWVFSMTTLGYLFGNNPVVRAHNEKVIIAIVAVSVVPIFIHAYRERRVDSRAAVE